MGCVITEVHADLFSYYNKGYWLTHCISADFKLGAGIAKEFDKKFNLRKDLLYALGSDWWKEYDDTFGGDALFHGKKRIIDLVTKTRYWHKPTLHSMRRALEKMCRGCQQHDINKIAMPRIGCGLDKLNWSDVSVLINDVFSGSDIEIVVCYL